MCGELQLHARRRAGAQILPAQSMKKRGGGVNASLLSSRFANTPSEIGKPCKRDSSPGFLHANVSTSGSGKDASEQLALATKMAEIGFMFFCLSFYTSHPLCISLLQHV